MYYYSQLVLQSVSCHIVICFVFWNGVAVIFLSVYHALWRFYICSENIETHMWFLLDLKLSFFFQEKNELTQNLQSTDTDEMNCTHAWTRSAADWVSEIQNFVSPWTKGRINQVNEALTPVSEMTQNKSVRSQGHSDACIDPSNSCRHGENSTPSTVSCFSNSNHPHQQQMHHALLAIASSYNSWSNQCRII